VLFVIYALLAIPFKSYAQPFIVMSVIPFGAIGALGGHWIMGMGLTMPSLMGLMALVGIVVNDSLVLVDYINKQKQNMGLNEAVLRAGAARFRPVMLTSLTTFIGLMPLLLEQSTQAQFLIPMAVSLGFGILFATFITLLLVPVNYILLENGKVRIRNFIDSFDFNSTGERREGRD
jgi:multidrug efflux pump subunit AcrB